MPKISCQESVEVVKSIPQKRISERMCEQSKAIGGTEISSQVQSWQITVEQIHDDTRHEPFSRISNRIREPKRFLNLLEKMKEKEFRYRKEGNAPLFE